MEPYVIDTQFQSSNQPTNSGLPRFRSAPSTLLSSLHRGGGAEKGFGQLPHHSPGKPIPRFLSTGEAQDLPPPPPSPGFEAVETKPPPDQYSGFGSNRLPMGYPKPGVGPEEGPFSTRSTQRGKGVGVGGANLARQSSSPAGFFTHLINAPNGNDHMMMRGGARNFRLGTASGGEASSSPPCSIGLKAHMDYSAGLSSPSLGHLPRIPEIGAETTTTKSSSPDGGDGHRNRYRNGEDDARWGFPSAAWNHHQQQSDTDQMYSVSEAAASQSGGEVSNRAPMLSHHLSFPKTSAEMAVAEKLLNFQDIVPCKIRAKRGFATHPRSIAERVRRTRISERMKKLQELVPNLDKQMNTAEMLDLAVDYIKDLQNQYKILCDCRARCRCLNAQYSGSN